jgi:hypothetical protein
MVIGGSLFGGGSAVDGMDNKRPLPSAGVRVSGLRYGFTSNARLATPPALLGSGMTHAVVRAMSVHRLGGILDQRGWMRNPATVVLTL